jgi:hypothetical protein
MFRAEVKQKIAVELSRGEAALQEGYMGRARVCARRAAGEAVREYLAVEGISSPGPGAVDLLEAVQSLAGVSTEGKEAARRLLVRVGEDFSLPVEFDLLADARLLAQELEDKCCAAEG